MDIVRTPRLLTAAAVLVVCATGGVIGVRVLAHRPAAAPSCTAGDAGGGYSLDPEQAANAATVAAVGNRRGLPNHAITVALAAALQESKLRNLPYGDRDSLGLFQQRPSQGWGTPTQLLTPTYAAAQFFTHLEHIRGWRTISVADAAQIVQHSADGTAYAQWEGEARVLARALTGEVAADLTCRFAKPAQPGATDLDQAAVNEIGPTGLRAGTASDAHAWLTASWLIAHAYQYGVTSITLRGRSWTNATGTWRHDARADAALHYRQTPTSTSTTRLEHSAGAPGGTVAIMQATAPPGTAITRQGATDPAPGLHRVLLHLDDRVVEAGGRVIWPKLDSAA
jgi:hypothetical protein